MGASMSYITYPEEHIIINPEKFNINNVIADKIDENDQWIIGKGLANKLNFNVFSEHKPIILNDKEPITVGISVMSAICTAIDFNEKKTGMLSVPRSRLFAFYNERCIQQKYYEDIECSIKQCIQTINSIGLCPEDMYSFSLKKLIEKPSDACFQVAKNHRKIIYKKVARTILGIKTIMAEYRLIIASIKVSSSGIEENISLEKVFQPAGGYCILICGWDDVSRKFKFLNSMGEKWGDSGYGTIQYEFLLDPKLTMDLWVIE